MALRWSADVLMVLGYKHCAPLEHSRRRTKPNPLYAMKGKSEDAVKWLNETAATGFPSYPMFQLDPYLNRIRQSPDFVQFITGMKEFNEKLRSEVQ